MADGPAPTGRLVLVPNALDHGSGVETPLDAVLPATVITRAASLTHWVVEDARSARAFLKRVAAHAPLARPLQELTLAVLPRKAHGAGGGVPVASFDELLAPARLGHHLGLLSEAGLPALADPGAALVAAAYAAGLAVESLPGPSSIALAVAASGLQGQQFTFVGYLPVDGPSRSQRIRALEDESARQQRTIVAIETPYRNRALMDALVQHLSPETMLGVACGLTLPRGSSITRRVAQWRHERFDFPPDHPAVFTWLRGPITQQATSRRAPARPGPGKHRTGQDTDDVSSQVRQRRRP